MRSTFQNKKLIVFDLDGTLAETKSNMDAEMARLMVRLLAQKQIAIIGGGKYEQFKKQFLTSFSCPPSLLPRLFLFPTTATSFYHYHEGWKKIYRKELSLEDRTRIKKAFRDVLREIHYVPPKKVYGPTIEDRKTQVTLSFLGQDIVAMLGMKEGVRRKKEWKRKHTDIKMKVAHLMQKRLPHLGVIAAGFTSIDVTKKGIDKGYGIHQIKKTLRVPIKDMLFVGDALYRDGNDYAVKKTGVDWIAVKGPAETKRIIKALIAG